MNLGMMSERQDAEHLIGKVWRETLKVPYISLDDNIFNLGGTSIHVVEAFSKLRDALCVPVTVLDLFHHPTIRSLVDHLFPTKVQCSCFQEASDRVAKQRMALATNRKLSISYRGEQI